MAVGVTTASVAGPTIAGVEGVVNETGRISGVDKEKAEVVRCTPVGLMLGVPDMTFITADPTEAIHWKRNGLLGHAETVVLVASDGNLPQQWAEAASFDHRTTVMLIDPGMEPERWLKDIPRDAAAIYSNIPDQAEELLVKDRHVAGTVSVHLKHLAQSVTTWPHDQYNETFGRPVTVKTKLIARLTLDSLE